MAEEKKQEFSDLQVRECDEIQEPVLPPEYCPTCIPNPSAIVPVWEEEENPFFNEKECLYQVSVSITDDGSFLTPSLLSKIKEKMSNPTDNSADPELILGEEGMDLIKGIAIREGFLKTGIRELLRYYDKLESDQTVFAFGDKKYSEDRINNFSYLQKELFAFYSTPDIADEIEEVLSLSDFLERAGFPGITRERYQELVDTFGDVYPLGLEWTATIDDVFIEFRQTKDGGVPIKFLISVPSENFNIIPEDFSPEESENPADQVELDAADFKGQVLRLGTAMWVFANYQKYFIDVEEGRVYFEDEPGRTYIASKFRSKVLDFKDDLIELVHDNGYRFPFELGLGRELISMVRITFNNTDPDKLYKIKKIEVKGAGCRGYVRLRRFLPKGFRNDTGKDMRTVAAYISRLAEIDSRLRARKTIEWLEFIKEYTYPKIKVNYGANSDDVPIDERDALGCILERDLGLGTGAGYNFVLSEVLSVWDTLAYSFNQIACSDDDTASEDAQKEVLKKIDKLYENLIKAQVDENVREAERDLRRRGVSNPRQAALDEFDMDREAFERAKPGDAAALRAQAEQAINERGIKNYPYYSLAKKAALDRFDYEDSLLSAVMKIFQRPDGKLKKPSGDELKAEINTRLGACGLNKLLLKAIQCLLGGMPLQEALSTMIKSALKAMTGGDLGRLFVGLPYDKQQEILRKVEKEVGKVPPPWEEEFKTGEVGTSFSSPQGGTQVVSQQDWNALPSDAQNELIEAAEAGGGKANVGAIQEQGSIGEAAGNIQAILVNAYIEAMMEIVAVETLLNELDKFPGAQIVANVLLQLACPSKPLFQPSPANFLKTLTLDVCDPTIGITWPKLRRLGPINWGAIFKALKEKAKEAIQQMFLRILMQLIYKLLVTLESILCRSFAAVGQFAIDAVNPNAVAGSLRSAFREAFCGPDPSDDRVDEIMENTIDYLGFGSGGRANDVINAISVTSTTEELLAMLVTTPVNYDPRALTRIATTISATAPEFADVLGSPEQVAELFSGIAEYLPPSDRARIRNNLDASGPELPINPSICLTNEEFDEWNEIRQNILTNSGLAPEEAAEYISDLNNRATERLGDFMDALSNLDSPGGIMGESFGDLLDPNGNGDPLCAGGPLVDIYRPQRNEQMGPVLAAINNTLFDQIQIQYTKDLIGRKGLLNYVLADTKDKKYKAHVRLTRNFLTGRFYADSQESYEDRQEDQVFPSLTGPIGVFPETVAIDLRNKLIDQTIDYTGETNITNRKSYTVEKKFAGIGMKNLIVKTSRRARKKPDFKLEYADSGEIPIPGGGTIDTSYITMSKFSNAVGTNDGLQKNFNYFVSHEYKQETMGTSAKSVISEYVVERSATTEQQEVIDSIVGNEEWPADGGSTYLSFIFRKYIDSKWNDSTGYRKISSDKMFNGINTHVLNLMKNYLVTVPGADPRTTNPSEISAGFAFGYEFDNLDPENFEYVGPDGEDYDYDEEEAVLGKMKVENDRVKILNPEIYGGKYSDPKIYVAPPERHGWLGLVDSLVPKGDGCDDEPDLMDIAGIKKHVSEASSGIPYDERLNIERACAREVPFDHIVDSGTHANLEGVVKAICRTFLSQQYLTGMPAFANLIATSGNYDDGFYEFVVNQMLNSMTQQSPRVGAFTKVKYLNYWLLFLEQCVQMYDRGVKNGTYTPSERINRELAVIREVQEKYYWPEDRNFYNNIKDQPKEFNLPGRQLEPDDLLRRFNFTRFAFAYQAYGENIFGSTEEISMRRPSYFRYMPLARFSTKILAIRVAQRSCIEILKEVLKAEADTIFTQFNERMRPRSPINDIQKYMLGLPEFSVGSSLKVGRTKYIIDKQTEGELADPGDIPHVISDPKTQSPLDAGGYDTETLAKAGLFVVEKYLRVIDKEDQTDVPNFVKNRPKKLFGVVNLKDFKQFVNNNSQSDEFKYSDCFGDMRFVYEANVGSLLEAGLTTEDLMNMISDSDDLSLRQKKELIRNRNNMIRIDGESLSSDLVEATGAKAVSVTGTTGVRYGVRICFIPPEGFVGGDVSDERALRNKALNVKQTGGPNTKYIFTIASAEVDLLDDKLSSYAFADSETDPYDIECMITKLTEDPDFKLFFDLFVPMRTYTSHIASFISLSFLSALGEHDSERENDDGFFTFLDPDGLSSWERILFDNTKRANRRLFANIYNSNDFNPDEDRDITLRDFFQQFNPFSSVVPNFLSWWQRRRLSDKPSDKCGNPFQDLFAS